MKIMFKKLKKVTPKAMKVYKKLGLMDIVKKSDAEAAEVAFDLFCDENQLKELAAVSFEGDFKDTNWDEIDLSELMEGISAFLTQLHGVMKK